MLENHKLQQALRSLNPLQLEAVTSDAKSLQIVAGPGSGKTKVLTCRVSYLISEKNINPSDIIVVTFTKKAATELQERLSLLIGSSKTNLLQIGTFHSICISILRRNARIVDMEPSFKVVDDRKRKEIIRALLKDESLPIKYAGRQIKADVILEAIELAKDRGENYIKFQNLYSGGSSQYLSILSMYYMAYELELRRQNIMDFGGLILKTCELLRLKDDVFFNIDCVLVDEFQDTSTSQYDLISLLLAQVRHRTITTVGDPDQSIYGWRVAKSRVFEEMKIDYPDTKVINLEQNYRSTVMVVESSNHIIVQDTKRINKAIYTKNPIGIPISLITTSDERTQAEYVAYEIGKVINYSKGLVQYKDIAVLMRANYSFRQFERTFRVHKIPFILKGGDRFFNRMEIKDMLGYLRFTSNPYDRASFVKIINVPERNIRKVTINSILAMNDSFGCNLFDTIDIFLHGEKRIALADRTELQSFLDLCHKIHKKILAEDHIAEILKFIYKETDYYKHLRKKYYYDHIGRWKNLGELVTIAGSKKEMGGYEDEEPGEIIKATATEEPFSKAKEHHVEVNLPTEAPKSELDHSERHNDGYFLAVLSEEAFSKASMEEEALAIALCEEESFDKALVEEEAFNKTLKEEEEAFDEALMEEEAFLEEEALAETLSKEKAFAKALLEEEALAEKEAFVEILSKETFLSDTFLAEEKFTEALLEAEAFAEALIKEEAFSDTALQKKEYGQISLNKKKIIDTQKKDLDTHIPLKEEFKEVPSLKEFESTLPYNSEQNLPEIEGNMFQEQDSFISKGIQNIEEFLSYCDSCKNQKQQKENEGGSVTLSTIHAAKGLEWPCVFIVTCAAGIIPALGDVDEEKRILYVAMTRSKFMMYCISPKEIGDWGKRKLVARTPFLENMNTKLYSTSSPVWNQELRRMLADTIHRLTPKNVDFLRGPNLPECTSSQPTPKSVPVTSVTRSSPGTGFSLYQPYSSSTRSKTKVTTVPTYNTSFAGTSHTSHQSSFTSFAGLKRAFDVDEKNACTKFKKEPRLDNFSFHE